MTQPTNRSPGFEPEAVRAKYQQERARRVNEARTAVQDLQGDPRFAEYLRDPWTPFVERPPVTNDTDVAIIGAGLAGLVLGAKLREAGVRRICLIDKAGGVGGTWYWNRYPGLFCDVESYIYMPMLEEMNVVPTSRYATGVEIHQHLEAIAQKYDLVDDALFHTGVETSEWDEASSCWVLRTDRGDEIRAHHLVVAPGILNLVKLPRIPGMEDFQGDAFHTSRWDYEATGGAPDDPRLTKLADKVVGVIGTGGTAIQCVPALAECSKHLYVFQRTPSAIGVRDNRPTDEHFAEQLRTGWQRERMENFSSVMIGRSVECDLVDDSWTHNMAKVVNPPIEPGMSPEEMLRTAEEIDYQVMEAHRARVEQIVSDPAVAEAMKPYYRYMCKRPLFHDEYLPTFNRSDVTLVDCPRGVEQVLEHGVVANGTTYDLDLIVYATGFEAEVTPFARRAGHTIIGRDGITMAEKWKDGVTSLHGMSTHGFPNMFIMPAPAQQAVTTVNYTHLAVLGAEHIAATIAKLAEQGVEVFDVRQEAEDAWTETIVSTSRDPRDFMASCTPSRLNFEGDPSKFNPRNGNYGQGHGDFLGFQDLLSEWRERGDFAGWELDQPHARG
ncbi:MAG TPA: NAD(P)/FAD-dependent oxidoreductase [Acidimicrobiia bacterium]|nr:NAD(P)/FAD-dependent oxidoreductase [Acidimicrobiia bacterium]